MRWLKEWQESEARAQQKLRDEDYYQLLTDRIENTLYTELKAQKEVRMQDLHSVIESDFVPEYHPAHAGPAQRDRVGLCAGVSPLP